MIPPPEAIPQPPLWLSLFAIPAMLIFFLLVTLRVWRVRRADRRRDRAELLRSVEHNCKGWWN